MISDLHIRDYFNSLAAEWKSMTMEEEQKIHEVLSGMNLKPKETILDLGCGSGILCHHLHKLTAGQAHIYAIDYAECMVFKAKKAHPAVAMICGDAHDLPFRNNYFDRIITFHVFPHLTEKLHVLSECRRILKPDGELCIFHLKGSREINAFHASLQGPVKTHVLPSRNSMCELLKEAQYKVKTSIEQPDLYLFQGIKI